MIKKTGEERKKSKQTIEKLRRWSQRNFQSEKRYLGK